MVELDLPDLLYFGFEPGPCTRRAVVSLSLGRIYILSVLSEPPAAEKSPTTPLSLT
jgi:hypothetical protein